MFQKPPQNHIPNVRPHLKRVSMKQIAIGLFNLIIFSSLAQVYVIEKVPQNEIETLSSDFNIAYFDSTILKEPSSYNLHNKNLSIGNIINVSVSRSPVEVLISKDDQFAFIRCFLGNTIEILKIPNGEVVNSLVIPNPKHFIFNNDTTKLFIASFTDYMIPPDPPADDCGIIGVPSSGFTFLTMIDISSQEISRIDTISMNSINRILLSSNDSVVYLVGSNVVEYNLNQRLISSQWELSQQIRSCKIDNKNNRIFITTISSVENDSLNVIDIETGNIITVPYNNNGEETYARFIGLDTTSNRIFIQGKPNPPEVLVYNTLTLSLIATINDVNLYDGCFFICPNIGSIFIGGPYPIYNTVELDYFTLDKKNDLPSPETDRWKTVIYNSVLKRLYSFKLGGYENSINFIYPPQKLDVLEYDINTGETFQYETTDSLYSCSYPRTLAVTNNGDYVISTNSPENTVSIIELSHESVDKIVNIESIDIYPNPTLSSVNIKLNKKFDSDFIVELYNIYGNLLLQQSRSQFDNNFTIDLTKLQNGQYFIHFESFTQSRTFKIMKM